jgi:Tfp pilus assembly protein PilF
LEVSTRRGLASDAENEFKAALRLSPQYTPATVNLADLYRLLGRNDDGQNVVRTALSHSPNSPDLHYALGLALTRLKRTEESLNEFQRAAELDPGREIRLRICRCIALGRTGRRRSRCAQGKFDSTPG